MPDDILRYAGQFVLDKVEILTLNGVGFNVINQVVQIDLFEDLFQPFMTGTIIMYESLDLINMLPLVGEEILKLDFHTPGAEKQHWRSQKFYIYKMTDLSASSDKSNIYQLHFISMDEAVNLNSRICQTFEGRVSDIVRKIATDPNMLGTERKVNIEDTQSTTAFTANYWTPLRCIDYVSRRALNLNSVPNYTFFENSQGFNFVSLDTLYSMPALYEFSDNTYTREITASGSAAINPYEDYKSIREFSVPVSYDYIDRCLGGMYGSQQVTADPITKRYSSKLFTGLDEFGKIKHLNPHSTISNSAFVRSEQAVIYTPKHYNGFTGYQDSTDSKYVQRRNSLLKQSDSFKVNVSALGRTEYTVGQKVYLDIHAKEVYSLQKDDIEDKVYSGNYLIGKIAHRLHVKNMTHDVDMELIKDSLIIDLNKGSPKR